MNEEMIKKIDNVIDKIQLIKINIKEILENLKNKQKDNITVKKSLSKNIKYTYV